jgi:hypothetical protein
MDNDLKIRIDFRAKTFGVGNMKFSEIQRDSRMQFSFSDNVKTAQLAVSLAATNVLQ